MDLGPGELIARVHLPRRAAGWRDYYRKVGTRRAAGDLEGVCRRRDPHARRARRRRAHRARQRRPDRRPRGARGIGAPRQRAHTGRDCRRRKTLVAEIAPIDDIRSTALYRTRVVCNLLREFLGDHG